MSCFRLPAQREMLTAELVQGYLADIKTPLSEFTYALLACLCARHVAHRRLAGIFWRHSFVHHAHDDTALLIHLTIDRICCTHF